MKVFEMFCGTCSFSNLFEDAITTDNKEMFNPDILGDVLTLDFSDIKCDVLWASPPCTFFSVASIGKHWHPDHRPKSDDALIGLAILDKTIETIAKLKPKYWFVENPRGKMRKVIDDIFERHGIKGYKRETVTYCQYGDTRMKPTDIWHNTNWQPKPMGKNGDPCHVSAPRGSRTGTQGLKGNKIRSIIPKQLCEEIKEAIWQE